MRLFTVSFLLATVFFQYQSRVPEFFWLFPLVLVFFVCLFVFRKFWFLGFVFGLVWNLAYYYQHLNWDLPASLVKKDVSLSGVVSSLPDVHVGRVSFVFRVDSLEYVGDEGVFSEQPGHLVSLSWYKADFVPQPGDVLSVVARLRPNHGFVNPGGFDFEKHLFAKRIRASGYIRELVRRDDPVGLRFSVDRVRQWLALKSPLGDERLGQSRFLKALTIGQRDGVSQDDWRVLQRTGTGHLLAISGLHVGLVSLFVYGFLFFLWRLWPAGCLWVNAHSFALFFACLVALFYCALAGFSIPTQRAAIMLSCLALTQVNRYKLQSVDALFLAGFFVLLLSPVSVLQPGFWLSFSAVGILIFGLSGRLKGVESWWQSVLLMCKAQFFVVFGLLPLTLLLFQQSSLVSFVANFFAIPFTSFVVVPPALLGCLFSPLSASVGFCFFWVADLALSLQWWFLETLSDFPAAHFWFGIFDGVSFVLVCLGFFVLLLPRGFPGKWVVLVAVVGLFFPRVEAPVMGALRLSVLDVGQGLSVVAQTRGHSLVYDTGPRFMSGFNTGQAVVAPFLRFEGVRQVDTLVVSHGDNDHVGGFESVVQQVPVRSVVSSEVELPFDGEVVPCVAGDSWVWDEVRFRFLHPRQSDRFAKRNNRSCVLLIEVGERKVLVAGDIEALVEERFVADFPELGEVDVLLVPHHGSKTSSTEAFVDLVSPKFAVFPVGFLNRYRLPNRDVVARYEAVGSRVLFTGDSGALLFEVFADREVGRPREFRKESQRIWRF